MIDHGGEWVYDDAHGAAPTSTAAHGTSSNGTGSNGTGSNGTGSNGRAVRADDIGTRDEFAAGLTALRAHAGLSVRELSRRLDTPTATLGGYFSGRHLPTVSQIPKLMQLLGECGVTENSAVDAWISALGRVRSGTARRANTAPPYRGLEAFGPDDADLFFGRADETTEILIRLRSLAEEPGPSRGLLAVLGPSGSGKSSLLRAGVVAAIRAGRLDSPGLRWTCRLTTPGSDPLTALTAALDPPAPEGDRRVLVVDQFEEIFTSVPDPSVRAEFLRRLDDRPADVLVVIGLRADFYAAAAAEPNLLSALQHEQLLVGPLSTDRVREAIVEPARRSGVAVASGLVDLVLADLAPHDAGARAHDAGALPLLSHAMLSTWERSDRRTLTIAHYRDAGGIDTAVQRTADALFTSLDADDRDLARRMFLRLVNIDDDIAVTRRRAGRDELSRLRGSDGTSADTLIDAFVERRLLTTHASAVEISHEALLSAWPRLRGWVDADRAGLRVQRRITEAATQWTESGEDTGLLLLGTRLDAATDWAAEPEHRDELDPVERRFLDESERRAVFERTRERRRSRRLRRLLAVVAVLAVVAGVLAVLALHSRSAALADRRSADLARRNALARQVSVESNELLASDPALSQQLALTAYRLSPDANSTAALIDASSSPSISRTSGHAGPTPLALAHDGDLVAVGDASDGSTRLYVPVRGRPDRLLSTLPGSGTAEHHQLYALAFTPDDHTLITGGDVADIMLWDVRDPTHPTRIAELPDGFAGAVQSIAVTPDGRTMAVASIGKVSLELWDIADPAAPTPLAAPAGQPRFTRVDAQNAITIKTVAFSPDGSQLVAGGTNEWLRAWPLRTAATTRPLAGKVAPNTAVATNTVAYSPTGSELVTVSGDGTIVYRRSSDLTVIRSVPTSDSAAPAYTATFAPDGSQLAVGSADGKLVQYSATTDAVLQITAHPGPVTGIAYSPDSSQILTTGADGSLWSWQSVGPTVQVSGSVFNISFSADGRRMVTLTNRRGGTQVWDTSEAAVPRRIGGLLFPPVSAGAPAGTGALRPDGRQLAVATASGNVALWTLAADGTPTSGPSVFHVSDKLIEYATYSPDGRILALAGDDAQVHFWDVSDPADARELAHVSASGFVFGAAYDTTGHLFATASADDHVRIYDVRNPSRPVQLAVLGGFSSYVYNVAFSAHGSLLAATGSNYSTTVWDVRDPRRPVTLGAPLVGPTDYNLELSFSDDGRLLAVPSNDGNVWVYATHGRRRPTLVGALRRLTGANVLTAVFQPHSHVLFGAGRLGQLAVWTVDPQAYARTACSDSGAPITPAEWKQYVPGAAYDPPCH